VTVDFTDYDASISDGITETPLIAFEDDSTKPETVPLPLRPPRQDTTPTSEFEQFPGYGDVFGQGDFSHGAGQRRFHSQGRDTRAYWYADGIDISDPGKLKLLHDASGLAVTSATIGRLEICNDLPFVVDNTGTTRVKRGDGAWPGTWTPEDPGGGATTVEDLTSSGDILYAAQNAVYQRTAAGAWSSWVTAGATAIDHVAWIKDRLFVSDGRNIYEITASGALPTAMETLPPSWRFEAIWEYGEFIYASAVSKLQGRSKIHHYGPNQDYSAIEKKGNTEMPRGQLIYAGSSYLGVGYLGGGVFDQDSSIRLHPIVYQCFADSRGFLTLVKLREDSYVKASHTDEDATRAFEPYGESMLYGWNDYDDVVDGATRAGLGIHYPARDAVANYLYYAQTGGAGKWIMAIRVYHGRVLYVVKGVGLCYESMTNYVSSGTLTTSFADFNTAGIKVWDTFEVSHAALLAGESVIVSATFTPESVSTTTVLTSDTDGDKGTTTTDVSNVLKGRTFRENIKLTRGTDVTKTPVLYSVSARANPAPEVVEFVLKRTFRILARDRKDDQAQPVFSDPDVKLNTVRGYIYDWVTFRERNMTWLAFVTSITEITPLLPEPRISGAIVAGNNNDVAGSAGYVVQLQMVARTAYGT